jgi:hypothetical protein
MIDLLPTFITVTKTLQERMEQWFARYPTGYPWTVVSDYVIGADKKHCDIFTFVIIAPHTTLDDIGGYIAQVAPNDIKNVRQVPLGLMQYLGSELGLNFSISFVIDRQSMLLRDYLLPEPMADFINEACDFVTTLRKNAIPSEKMAPTYYGDVVRRLCIFGKDLKRKNPNDKLSRQIYLTAGFLATVFYLVTCAKEPRFLRWISDRDKLIEHNETVVYDLAHIFYLLMVSGRPGLEPDEHGNLHADIPQVLFEIPERTGKHRFDALVRLADYLAGTLADMNSELQFSKEKFEAIFNNVFLNAPNHWFVNVSSDGKKISARSGTFLTS